jgi:hypothetical protein
MGTFYISKPELTYVHVPRTGMAMKKIISDWLKPNFDVDDKTSWMINHPSLQMVREHISTGKTMSVVRNPWQRVYSFYRKISTEGYWLDWNGMTLLELKPINEWVLDYCNPDIPFEFPRWFNKTTNQIDFINYNGNWVDFIIKAEELETGFEPVQEYLECAAPLPDISGYDHWEFKKYFNNASIQAIKKVHEQDVDFFKYTV